MAAVRNASLLLLCLLAAGLGCQRRAMSPGGPLARGRAEFAAPAWGAATGGLQCRLRPTKRLWHAGETPTFRVDLRNRGPRVFALTVDPLRPDRISINDKWHQRLAPDSAGRKVVPFGPASDFADLPWTLPPQAASLLTQGRHTVRIAFVFEGIEVTSNPVEIEIAH